MYLFLTLLSVVIQGLFAFFEMACISFNRIRLQYYVGLGTRRALWLNYLLQRPSRLFGTTLIGIIATLVIGSECARRFYESIHLDPDWAPLTQIPLVVIFGELIPMFAARRYPEQSAFICSPLMILLARLLSPITWTFDAMARFIHRCIGKEGEVPLSLNREEVRMAFEEKKTTDEFDAAASRIFQLKNLTAHQLMTPLQKVQMVSSLATVADVRSAHPMPMVPIYHRQFYNIVGVVFLRDLLGLEDQEKIIHSAHSPWFVTRDIPILQLLHQFRRNNQSMAVILEPFGQAAGILTLDEILDEIFGEEASSERAVEEPVHYIERTLSGEMSTSEFNLQFHAALPEKQGSTLSELITAHLGHLPAKGESARIGDLEFVVEETSLRGIKTLSVRSVLGRFN